MGLSDLRDSERAAMVTDVETDETRSKVLWWFLWFPGVREWRAFPTMMRTKHASGLLAGKPPDAAESVSCLARSNRAANLVCA